MSRFGSYASTMLRIARSARYLHRCQPSVNVNYTRTFMEAPRRRDAAQRDDNGLVDIEELLSTPTWSVAALLPSNDGQPDTPQITSKQLHHLLRLSALPPPKDEAEEATMLSTLSSQLHFVKEIQKVDTTGVQPLRSLRDETKEGKEEAELDLEALRPALEDEEVIGIHHKRIRRKRGKDTMRKAEGKEEEDWDVLGTAPRKGGRFFVVEGGKEG